MGDELLEKYKNHEMVNDRDTHYWSAVRGREIRTDLNSRGVRVEESAVFESLPPISCIAGVVLPEGIIVGELENVGGMLGRGFII